MALTYVNIASQTLGSASATVTFSSIPSTYTDLVLIGSIRDTEGSTISNTLQIRANNDASAIYSYIQLQGAGSGSGNSTLNTSRTRFTVTQGSNGSTSTASTFASFELYIPNYTVSSNNPAGLVSVVENNAATAYVNTTAQLFRSTAAISRLDILSQSGNASIASGSSFYLYGIKKN
jgi:hypothetical protein